MKALLAMALVLLAAACGGSDAAQAGPIEVTGTDFKFRPDLFRASGETEVTLTNIGSVVHEWVILSEPIESEDGFTEDLVLFRIEADSGESTTGVFEVAPGEYQVICAIEGHFNSGMEGLLRVEAP